MANVSAQLLLAPLSAKNLLRHFTTDTLASAVSALGQPRILATLALGYVLLVRALRHRRMAQHDAIANLTTQSTQSDRNDRLGGMKVATAQKIFLSLGELEFPFMMEKALQFALFRTYGIPSISSLLARTSLFSAVSTAHKRYADTGALIVEFTLRDFGSKEFVEALARLNCIHGVYRRDGRILDQDMLYTLALFALEPERWVARYEWRSLSETERCALGVLWKAIGDAMRIPWTGLKAHDAGKPWRDGLHWLDDLAEWTEAYESTHMVPAKSNATVAAQTTTILLWNVPMPLKPVGEQAVSTLMDPRLRASMQFAPPSLLVKVLVQGFLRARQLFLRHLALPRPEWARLCSHEERSKDGTVNVKFYQALPYYVRPTLWNTWGPPAWASRFLGIPIPGAEGDRFYPQGFVPSAVGPAIGRMDQQGEEARVTEMTRAKCPFAFGSLE